MSYDTRVPVLVLKIGRYVFHHGGLGIIRSLGQVGMSVYGVHEDRFAPAAVSKYLSGRYIWKTDTSDSHLVRELARIGQHIGRPTIIIPTDDFAAILVAENAASLKPWFVFPNQPPDLPRSLANKQRLHSLCREMGVPCPETCFPRSPSDLDQFLDRAVFPVILKKTESWPAKPDGLRGTRIVRTPNQLIEICRTVMEHGQSQLMVQEYIPKAHGQDWIFHGYCDAHSECVVSFTGVKLRSYPAFAGPTTLGRSEDNNRLRSEAEAMLKSLSYRGIMDLDYRFDPRDGRYKLLDFNPRVGANFRMFQDESGIDVVRALHLDLTGRRAASARMRQRRFVVENYDLLASIAYHRAGDLTIRQWLLSLRSIDEAGWFAWDDLLPFFTMLFRFLVHGVARSMGLCRTPERHAAYFTGRARRRRRAAAEALTSKEERSY